MAVGVGIGAGGGREHTKQQQQNSTKNTNQPAKHLLSKVTTANHRYQTGQIRYRRRKEWSAQEGRKKTDRDVARKRMEPKDTTTAPPHAPFSPAAPTPPQRSDKRSPVLYSTVALPSWIFFTRSSVMRTHWRVSLLSYPGRSVPTNSNGYCRLFLAFFFLSFFFLRGTSCTVDVLQSCWIKSWFLSFRQWLWMYLFSFWKWSSSLLGKLAANNMQWRAESCKDKKMKEKKQMSNLNL